MIKVIIAGSRHIVNAKQVEEAFREWATKKGVRYLHNVAIISGGARGVDTMGEIFAKENGINLIICPANWDYHNKGAGHKRNAFMAEVADELIAVWDGESTGTKNMITTMLKLKKPVHITLAKPRTILKLKRRKTSCQKKD